MFQWTHATSTLAERTAETFLNGTYESIRWAPGGTRGALLASGANAIYVWFIAPDGTRSSTALARGIVASTGCNDVSAGRPRAPSVLTRTAAGATPTAPRT